MLKPILEILHMILTAYYWILIAYILGSWIPELRKTKVPYGDTELFHFGPQRTFEGEALSQIAFPLGGIGTGTISLGGRGQLKNWEIFNRPNKGFSLPYSFFAIKAREKGKNPVARVLESKLLPPFGRGSGLLLHTVPGLPQYW